MSRLVMVVVFSKQKKQNYYKIKAVIFTQRAQERTGLNVSVELGRFSPQQAGHF